ncbi:MAG: B12-binding domain-containing radical SAM protein [Sulfurimonas sp.]|nr:B12-binding domain-containing radical SAM protein [Sulfurimonas sp.]
MNQTKILLVAPTYIDKPNTMYFPIGMAYLASYMKSKNYYVDGLNLSNYGLDSGLKEIQKKLMSQEYNIIGIGALTVAFSQIERLVLSIREFTDAKIVFGGGVTSCESELVLETLKADYMVISEGELIFEELVAHIEDPISNKLPKGVWSKKGKKVISNSESYAIDNLDDLPFPDYEIMGIKEFINLQPDIGWNLHNTDMSIGKYMPISASRSCPFKCTFCHHAGMGDYRKHSVSYAISFIKEMLKRYKVTHFSIYDELFSMNKSRVMEFCDALKPLNITFMCQLRVDQIDIEMLKNMRDAGCVEISYGIESGSQKVIDSMHKKITVEQIENAVKLTREAKVGIQGNFLFGDPAETKETVQESLEFQKKNKLYFADWSMVIPYPGTVLHRLALSENLIKDRVEFIKVVADTSKYLWNNPINLTVFSDQEYIEEYTRLREQNDINHRKVLSEIIEAKRVNSKYSNLKIRCPNCSSLSQYEKLPFPLNSMKNLTEDRESFFGFLGMNIVCHHCRQKHHLLPKNRVKL